MQSKKILANASGLSYKIYGNGEPVLLIHGFAEDSTVWDKQVEFLKDNYLLIVPDLPGSGESEILHQDFVSLDDFAECLRILLDEEKIDRCVMIGHSMGGYITLAFAEKYPDRLKRFMLFHSSAYADDAEKIEAREKGIRVIEEKGPLTFLKATIPGLFYEPGKNRLEITDLEEKGEKFSAEALKQYYRAMINRPDRTNVLKTFGKLIGFVLGEKDKAVPFEAGLRQTHLVGLCDIHIFRHSAHMSMLEETEKANKTLDLFLGFPEFE